LVVLLLLSAASHAKQKAVRTRILQTPTRRIVLGPNNAQS